MERHHNKDENKSLTPHKNKSNSFGSVCDARVTFLKYSHNRWIDKIICKKFGKCEATQNTQRLHETRQSRLCAQHYF